MSPISRNHIKKSVAPKSLFPDMSAVIDDSVSMNQGELIVLTSNKLAVVTTGELGANFVGVATQSIVDGLPVSPIQGTDVDGSEAIPALSGPVYGVTAMLVLKTSDALNPGDAVYIDGASGARNVTATQAMGAKAIGVYQGAAIASAAAGQEIEVLVGACYPNGAPQF